MKNRTILVPVDLSDVSARVVDEAIGLSRAMNADVRLFHVEYSDMGFVEHDCEFRRERLRFYNRPGGTGYELAKLKAHLQEEGIAVTSKCGKGNPVWRIVREAKRVNAQLIVIGSHGHGAFYHFLSGGVGERIRRLAPCPVVVVKSEPAELSRESLDKRHYGIERQ